MNTCSGFSSVVFSGGGSRCFWQLGFWNNAAPAIGIRPSVVAAASAGAAFACFALASDGEDVLRYFKESTGNNRRNFYPSNFFNAKPVFPHYRMYRDAILYSITDDSMKKLLNGPEIKVLITRPPFWMGARLAAVIGVSAYNIEKHIFYPLHPVFTRGLGFSGEIISVNECGTREELADLILQSSCAPPLLPVMKRGGRIALDGGMTDNVPTFILDNLTGKKLVLLTRRYKESLLEKTGGFVYVQPSEDIPITKWEYTDPAGLQYVYDLGRRDADRFVKEQVLTD